MKTVSIAPEPCESSDRIVYDTAGYESEYSPYRSPKYVPYKPHLYDPYEASEWESVDDVEYEDTDLKCVKGRLKEALTCDTTKLRSALIDLIKNVFTDK